MEVCMTNLEALKALESIKTYCAADALDAVEYAMKVLEKLSNEGIEKPLETSFKK